MAVNLSVVASPQIAQQSGPSAWYGLDEVFSKNDATASTLVFLNGSDNNYLEISKLVANIPNIAAIKGILVTLTLQSVGSGEIGLDVVQLVKNGIPVGANKGNPALTFSSANSSPLTLGPYGGSTDLWGTTWTPQEINNNNFGLRIRPVATTTARPALFVDAVRVTIYYQAASQAALDQVIIPPTNVLTLDAQLFDISVNVVVLPASLSLTAYAVIIPEIYDTAVLSLQAQSTKVNDIVSPTTSPLTLLSVGAVIAIIVPISTPAQLTLNSFQPIVNDIVSPATAAMSLQGIIASIKETFLVDIAQLVLTGEDATVLFTDVFQPSVAQLTLQSYDATTPLYVHAIAAAMTISSSDHFIGGTTRELVDMALLTFNTGDHTIT